MGIELQQYGFRIERTAKRIKQHMQRRFNAMDAGITVDQWVILDLLNQTDGMSQYEIAERTYKDAPTVTRIIDLLCKKELTERKMDENDRRKFNICLTRAGRNKINDVLPVVKEVRQQGWNSLSDEDYHNLLRILDIIFTNFR